MLGTAIRAKRDIIERIGPATSRIAGLPSISWRCALSISERCSFCHPRLQQHAVLGALSGLLHAVQQNLFQPRLERDLRQLRLKPDNALHDCAGQRDANRGDHRAGILTPWSDIGDGLGDGTDVAHRHLLLEQRLQDLEQGGREISPGTSSSASFGELRASNCRSCCTSSWPSSSWACLCSTWFR